MRLIHAKSVGPRETVELVSACHSMNLMAVLTNLTIQVFQLHVTAPFLTIRINQLQQQQLQEGKNEHSSSSLLGLAAEHRPKSVSWSPSGRYLTIGFRSGVVALISVDQATAAGSTSTSTPINSPVRVFLPRVFFDPLPSSSFVSTASHAQAHLRYLKDQAVQKISLLCPVMLPAASTLLPSTIRSLSEVKQNAAAIFRPYSIPCDEEIVSTEWCVQPNLSQRLAVSVDSFVLPFVSDGVVPPLISEIRGDGSSAGTGVLVVLSSTLRVSVLLGGLMEVFHSVPSVIPKALAAANAVNRGSTNTASPLLLRSANCVRQLLPLPTGELFLVATTAASTQRVVSTNLMSAWSRYVQSPDALFRVLAEEHTLLAETTLSLCEEQWNQCMLRILLECGLPTVSVCSTSSSSAAPPARKPFALPPAEVAELLLDTMLPPVTVPDPRRVVQYFGSLAADKLVQLAEQLAETLRVLMDRLSNTVYTAYDVALRLVDCIRDDGGVLTTNLSELVDKRQAATDYAAYVRREADNLALFLRWIIPFALKFSSSADGGLGSSLQSSRSFALEPLCAEDHPRVMRSLQRIARGVSTTTTPLPQSAVVPEQSSSTTSSSCANSALLSRNMFHNEWAIVERFAPAVYEPTAPSDPTLAGGRGGNNVGNTTTAFSILGRESMSAGMKESGSGEGDDDDGPQCVIFSYHHDEGSEPIVTCWTYHQDLPEEGDGILPMDAVESPHLSWQISMMGDDDGCSQRGREGSTFASPSGAAAAAGAGKSGVVVEGRFEIHSGPSPVMIRTLQDHLHHRDAKATPLTAEIAAYCGLSDRHMIAFSHEPLGGSTTTTTTVSTTQQQQQRVSLALFAEGGEMCVFEGEGDEPEEASDPATAGDDEASMSCLMLDGLRISAPLPHPPPLPLLCSVSARSFGILAGPQRFVMIDFEEF